MPHPGCHHPDSFMFQQGTRGHSVTIHVHMRHVIHDEPTERHSASFHSCHHRGVAWAAQQVCNLKLQHWAKIFITSNQYDQLGNQVFLLHVTQKTSIMSLESEDAGHTFFPNSYDDMEFIKPLSLVPSCICKCRSMCRESTTTSLKYRRAVTPPTVSASD